jgi:hypothetical protein
MKKFVGKEITVDVPFMDETVPVRKLTVLQVMEIQKFVAKANKSKAEDSQIGLIRDVLRLSVIGAEKLTDEEFNGFPLGELSKLSEQVLAVSGLGESQEAKEVGN